MATASEILAGYSAGYVRHIHKPWSFNACRQVFGVGTTTVDSFFVTPPTAAVTYDRTSVGALNYQTGVAVGSDWYLTGVRYMSDSSQTSAVQLWDRLAAQGGLSATVTTAQTTNLPLTLPAREAARAVPYVGVHIGLVIYSAIGSTATTVTVSYTNQDGVSGRTSVATLFGGSSGNERSVAGLMIPVPLQAGDTGVQSVQSVTVLASTGTAGNFGVVLLRPISMLAVAPMGAGVYGNNQIYGPRWGGVCCHIPADACLWPTSYGINSSTGGAMSFEFLELP